MSRLDELCRMYAEKSDAELLMLSDGFEDLTDDAQQALTKVMGERGLERDVEATGEVEEQVEVRSCICGRLTMRSRRGRRSGCWTRRRSGTGSRTRA